jgi:hypothetical protein
MVGVRRETLVINLPGGINAAIENLSVVLPLIPHAVAMLRNNTAHPESDMNRMITIEENKSAKSAPERDLNARP